MLLALPHEPEVLTVLGLDGEMKEVIGHVDLGHEVPTMKEVPHCMQALHLEVLVPQVAVERTKIEATSHLGCVLLRDWEECAPQAALGVGWELLHGCCF